MMVKLRWRWFREEYCDTLSARSLMVSHHLGSSEYQTDVTIGYMRSQAISIGFRFSAPPEIAENSLPDDVRSHWTSIRCATEPD